MAYWSKLTLLFIVALPLVLTYESAGTEGLYSKQYYSRLKRSTRVKKSVILRNLWTSVKHISSRFVKPIKQIFNPKEDSFDSKEHGNLDFVGRDVIRKVSKVAKSIREKIGLSSNSSTGLDTDKSFFSGVADSFKQKLRAIYPGTKWCGDGNRARGFCDLGRFSMTDACCREHDNCPSNIEAGGSKYGLHNTGLFTRSDCSCDMEFYDCLKTANSIISSKIGFTYFTILGPQCFSEDYPVISCNEYKNGKCIEYEYDLSSEPIYQWFDSPTF